MYDNIAKIANKFGLKPINIYKCRYYYVLNCSNGAYSLSQARPKINKINEIHKVKGCLFDYGIHNIDKYCVTENGLPYFEEDGKVYVVSKFFGSNELDFLNNNQVSVAINEIGRIHKGLKFMNEEMLFVASENNPTLNMYKNKAKSLENVKRIILQKGIKFWSKDKIKVFLELIEESNENYQRLKEVGYGRVSTYCHCGLKEGNIIYKKGKAYIIDWDNMKYLNYIEDIAFFIKRYVRKNCFYAENHNMEYFSLDEMLKRYIKFGSFDDKEIESIKYVLLYPHRFVSTMEEFFRTSKNFVPSGVKNKLDEIVEQREFMKNYILKSSL